MGLAHIGRLQRAHRRASEPIASRIVRWGAGLLAVVLCIPLVSSSFLAWVDGPSAFHEAALQSLLLRSGIVVAGWIALDTFSILVREGDRAMLAIWPVDPAETVRYEMLRLARQKLVLVGAIALLFTPLIRLGATTYALAVGHTLVVWASTLPIAAVGILGAVEASDNPRAQAFLNPLRGNNHPAQVAFIYAPGGILALCGALAFVAAMGVTGAQNGSASALWMGVPLVVAAPCVALIPMLARRTWFRAGTVVADIDAQYAVLESTEEALEVYLGWTARFLPEAAGRYALKDLRHGWRTRRLWVSGAWLAGLVGLASSWTSEPSAVFRTAVWVSVAVWWSSAVTFQLQADEPEFLRAWLPAGGRPSRLGRVWVVMVWTAPIVALSFVGTLVRAGSSQAAFVVGVGAFTMVMASVAATWLAERGGRLVYGPVAALSVLMFALTMGGSV